MTLPAMTYVWWAGLCLVGLLNIALWCHAARWNAHAAPASDAEASWRRAQLVLSAVYVLGCAYRSAFPVFDVPRQTLFDSPFSSALVGRSVATVAELCFAAQWGLLLVAMGRTFANRAMVVAGWYIVPLIALAEVCSWYSVLTTSNLGHVFEESLWALCAAAVMASLAWAWPRCARPERSVLVLGCLLAAVYTAYMVVVDVPMYATRWLADEASAKTYLALGEGVLDAGSRWHATSQWAHWRSEVVWMSLYFSVGVWMSIGLVHMPSLRPAMGRAPGRAAAQPAFSRSSRGT